jgi:antitoxin component YwqK of YwqJK toxin-antitoxin module
MNPSFHSPVVKSKWITKILIAFTFVLIALVGKTQVDSLKTVDFSQLIEDKATGLITFNGNIFTGKYISKHENGKKQCDPISVINGLREGYAVAYYPNGKKQVELTYQKGKINGKVIAYYENGQKQAESILKDMKPYGNTKSWFPNGKIQSTAELINGTGKGKTFDQMGRLIQEVVLKDGEIVEQKDYDENGKLIKYEKFKDGVSIYEEQWDGGYKFVYTTENGRKYITSYRKDWTVISKEEVPTQK